MRAEILTDRCRIEPQTGEPVARDWSGDPELQARVGRSDRSLTVLCPRGGVAHAQVLVVLDAPGDGGGWRVRCEPLRSDKNAALERIDVYAQYPQRSAEGTAFDALVPLEAYLETTGQVRDGPQGPRRAHAFWIDVPVPRDAAPGLYRGAVRLEGPEDTHAFDLTVRVLEAVLPLIPSVVVSLNGTVMPSNGSGVTFNPDDEEYPALERKWYRLAHDHRTVFHYLGTNDHSGHAPRRFTPPLAGRGRNLRVADWSRFDRAWGPLFDGTAMRDSPGGEWPIPHWYLPHTLDWPAHFIHYGKPGYDREYASILAEFMRHFHEKGWTRTKLELFMDHKKRYRYWSWDGDEPKHGEDIAVFARFAEILRQARALAGPAGKEVPVVYRIDASWIYSQWVRHPVASTLFDLWVAGSGNFSFDPEASRLIRARGQLSWWYGPGIPTAHPCQQCTFYAPLIWRRQAHGALLGWINTGPDRTLDEHDNRVVIHDGRRFGIHGPLPSLQLKLVRKGTELADGLARIAEREGFAPAAAVLDEAFGVREEDWWGRRDRWLDWPGETMNNDMYRTSRRDLPTQTGPALCGIRAEEAIWSRLEGV